MRTYRLEIRLIQAAIGLASIVLIAGFFGLWGQNGQVPEETTGPVVTTPAPPVSNTKIVALGDSFTLGYPLDAGHSWTQRLADVLKVEVINKGKVNQTSKDLLARFDADVVAEKPAQVIIFAGMGDGIEGVNRDEVQANIKAMVEKAKANEIIPILALPIPYPGAQQNIQDIRETELSYAKQENIMILDFSSVLFDANNKYLSGFSSTDGQYPNDKGYVTMGDYAAETLK